MPISDRRMFELWRRREALKEEIVDLNRKVKKIDDALLAEFERRGIDSIEERGTGQQISYIAAETTIYFKDQLRRRLSRNPRGRAILKRAEFTDIDLKVIAGEVLAGNIPPKVVAACSEIKTNAPYLKGSGGGDR